MTKTAEHSSQFLTSAGRVLVYLAGAGERTVPEITEALGIPETTVRRGLTRLNGLGVASLRRNGNYYGWSLASGTTAQPYGLMATIRADALK